MFGTKQKITLPRSTRGFSLLELLVSLSIIVLVTAAVVARNNAFESAVLLRNQAYLVASAVREAQLLAVSGTGLTSEIQRFSAVINLAEPTRISIIRESDGLEVNNIFINSPFLITEIRDNTNAYNSTTDVITMTANRPNYDLEFFHNGSPISGPVEIEVSRVGSGAAASRIVSLNASGQVSVENSP